MKSKTKIILEFETQEEYKQLLERLKDFEYIEKHSDKNKLEDVEIYMSKDITEFKVKDNIASISANSINLYTSQFTTNSSGLIYCKNKKEINLNELEEKTINYIYDKLCIKDVVLSENDIEIIKILFNKKD